jgi:hypothetical protein
MPELPHSDRILFLRAGCVDTCGFVALLGLLNACDGQFRAKPVPLAVAFALPAAAGAMGFGLSRFWCLWAPSATVAALSAAGLP